eukprot:scaffold41772_cov33-Phaeocystis_antarctica.AAC.2
MEPRLNLGPKPVAVLVDVRPHALHAVGIDAEGLAVGNLLPWDAWPGGLPPCALLAFHEEGNDSPRLAPMV